MQFLICVLHNYKNSFKMYFYPEPPVCERTGRGELTVSSLLKQSHWYKVRLARLTSPPRETYFFPRDGKQNMKPTQFPTNKNILALTPNFLQ